LCLLHSSNSNSDPVMDTLQFRDFIHKKAQRGEALSEDEIGTLATETADLAGNEPVRGHSGEALLSRY